jgi:hypothetical protein
VAVALLPIIPKFKMYAGVFAIYNARMDALNWFKMGKYPQRLPLIIPISSFRYVNTKYAKKHLKSIQNRLYTRHQDSDSENINYSFKPASGWNGPWDPPL